MGVVLYSRGGKDRSMTAGNSAMGTAAIGSLSYKIYIKKNTNYN